MTDTVAVIIPPAPMVGADAGPPPSVDVGPLLVQGPPGPPGADASADIAALSARIGAEQPDAVLIFENQLV